MIRIFGRISRMFRIVWLGLLPSIGLASALLLPAVVEQANAQPASATAAVLPANFLESVVFSGLDRPTAVRFAGDGRVFVAQKNGVIKVFSNLSATTATTFADLRTEVDDYWDRGLLGLALDPNFPSSPYIYALYSFDAPIGGTAPT